MPAYDDNLEGYLRELFAVEDDVLKTIRENIAVSGLPQMTIKPEEGRFLEFIVAASGFGDRNPRRLQWDVDRKRAARRGPLDHHRERS